MRFSVTMMSVARMRGIRTRQDVLSPRSLRKSLKRFSRSRYYQPKTNDRYTNFDDALVPLPTEQIREIQCEHIAARLGRERDQFQYQLFVELRATC